MSYDLFEDILREGASHVAIQKVKEEITAVSENDVPHVSKIAKKILNKSENQWICFTGCISTHTSPESSFAYNFMSSVPPEHSQVVSTIASAESPVNWKARWLQRTCQRRVRLKKCCKVMSNFKSPLYRSFNHCLSHRSFAMTRHFLDTVVSYSNSPLHIHEHSFHSTEFLLRHHPGLPDAPCTFNTTVPRSRVLTQYSPVLIVCRHFFIPIDVFPE